jgi:membrane fusion protein (multidrug efflux system)
VRLDQAKASLDAAARQADTAEAAIRSTSQFATAQTTQAEGTIGEAKASIQASKAAVTAAEAGVPRAEAQLQEANATLQREDTDLHRYEDLYAKEQVSKQTLDHQRASYEVAVAAQAAAQEQVRQAQAQLVAAQQGVARTEALLTNSQGGLQSAEATKLETRVREGQHATALAAVAQATAALEDANLQLSYTIIKAPVAGRVGRKSVEAGQRVQIGQPLMAIVEDQAWVSLISRKRNWKRCGPASVPKWRSTPFQSTGFMDTSTASLQAPAMNSRCYLRTMRPATLRKLSREFRSRSCSIKIACAATRTCCLPACRQLLL